MPRRRYRLFTVCAVLILFLLYRVLQNTWDDPERYVSIRFPSSPQSPAGAGPPPSAYLTPAVNGPPKEVLPQVPLSEDETEPDSETTPTPTSKPKPKPMPKQNITKEESSKNKEEALGVKIPILKDIEGDDKAISSGKSSEQLNYGETSETDTGDSESTSSSKSSIQDDLMALKPKEGKTSETEASDGGEDMDIHWKNLPGGVAHDNVNTRIHWVPVTEHFPLPTESIIPLPTGGPEKIPRVQHEFGVESPESKTKRVQRQDKVRKEIERAWGGYKKFAWMHDELSPVSAKYRDPFCGWAATLVDSLDTLWIAGLKDEFDEAAKAVKDIDFTYTPRTSIPVFETTIRYLGGLLGAFDVSGGHDGGYPELLEKAVELAEILMGIFDTPNRMPVLYYQWQPEFASQPHRASTVGIAELGTLSLEFTRLAQLTSSDKYFDAVDRITNALIDMQQAGTAIPGLFPENLDASGCNRTATSLRDSLSREAQNQVDSKELTDEPEGFVLNKSTTDAESRNGFPENSTEKLDEFAVVKIDQDKPEDAEDSSNKSSDVVNKIGEGDADKASIRAAKSHLDNSLKRRDVASTRNETSQIIKQVPEPQTPKRKPPYTADGSQSDWDCVPQGLVPNGHGYQHFHMGGGQDSAYEYFPKEYLLLGGLEPKYQKLHEDTIKAIDEWLLYRPMTKDDWDILFTARVTTRGEPKKDLEAAFEITHLTCFIGGMYGLGGKIFNREQDIETAKRLTNGCVWAYQITASGIMPEGARVLSCPTLEKCEFNQTLWYEELDPSRSWREEQVEEWEKKKAALDAEPAKDSLHQNEELRTVANKDALAKTDAANALQSSAENHSDDSLKQQEFDRPPSSGEAVDSAKALQNSAENFGDSASKGKESDPFLRPDGAAHAAEDLRKYAGEFADSPSKQKEVDPFLRSDGAAEAAEALQHVAENVGPSSSKQELDTPLPSGRASDGAIHKRAAVPVQGQTSPATEDAKAGSELPESLKKKVGFKDENQETATASSSDLDNSEKPDTLLEKEPAKQSEALISSQRDPAADSVLEANRLPPLKANLSDRPQTHEEFVKEKIKTIGLPPGFVGIPSKQYILRPEAIESVWYMYRITGDPTWMEKGWTMFEATIRATRTEIANSAIDDVTFEEPGLKDEMESFWLAETLKYYYLLFSEPNVISLDEWVLNTEAHPFKRPSMLKV